MACTDRMETIERMGTRPYRAALTFARMSRFLFAITLALYGFSAMELHEWVRVPQVVLHLLEHHSDLGHHDKDGSHHGHDGQHDHSPFDKDCHGEFCACSGMVALTVEQRASAIVHVPLTTILGLAELPIASGTFTGGVWNPPKA